MILSESGKTAHLYLFIAGVVGLLMFIIYVYIYDHHNHIETNAFWRDALKKAGISEEDIKHITHDGDTWHHRRKNLCVAHSGDFEEACSKHHNFCSGGDTSGTADEQAQNIFIALKNEGEHPLCPLIYSGTN